MVMADLVLIGRVARAHGNKGQVIVNLDTDFPDERFRAGAVVLVGPDARPFTIGHVRFHQGRPVVALVGIDTMNEAEALAGAELKVPAGASDALPAGTFYHYDLIGCLVTNTAGQAIGDVTAVEGTMEMSRLVVAGTRGEVLIPLVADICVEVDPAARRIVVNPPDGLLELNAELRSEPAEEAVEREEDR
jgi:16S rRNA processing protein RimM